MSHRRRAKGQATIELALILPVIAALVIGTQWVGSQIATDVNVTNAAQAGAQAAADTVDDLNAALSCAAPASLSCVQTAKELITKMVDAALPCGTGYSAGECSNAVQELGKNAAPYEYFCVYFLAGGRSGCNAEAATTLLGEITAATTCTMNCLMVAETLAQGAMEDGLGCDQRAECPSPLNSIHPCDPASDYVDHNTGQCLPDCALPAGKPKCTKPVMLEMIAGLSQLGTACAAVRHLLNPNEQTATCIQSDGDDPWIETNNMPLPIGTVPYIPCTYVPVLAQTQLFASKCSSVFTPQPANNMVVEQITIHFHNSIVATASAVPSSQFTIS